MQFEFKTTLAEVHGSRTHPRPGSWPSNRFEDGEAHRDPSTSRLKAEGTVSELVSRGAQTVERYRLHAARASGGRLGSGRPAVVLAYAGLRTDGRCAHAWT